MVALRKMTLLPAERLDDIAPAMVRKGRVQVGSDADLTLFDPERIIDRATYEASDRYAAGIEHVLVAGTFVVRGGTLVEAATPGRPSTAATGSGSSRANHHRRGAAVAGFDDGEVPFPVGLLAEAALASHAAKERLTSA